MSKTRTIKVDYLARVEGEGALYVRVKGDRVEEVRLQIFEPPRFFEAFLRGRAFEEAPDITARICGICPVAYQMSAVHAIEDALGIRVDGALRELRRLLYCGEWIESHTLHVAMLHAPDFLGYEDAIRMAKDHPKEVQRALDLKKAGNEIVRVIGGREIHPVNVRVGGFYRVPTRAELAPLVDTLERAREQALDTGSLGLDVRHARLRAGLRVRGAAPPVGVPVQRRPPGVEQGARHRHPRLRRALRRGARGPLERAPLGPQGARRLFRRPDGPLQPEFRPAPAARAAGRSRCAVCRRSAATRSRASWSAPWRCSTRSTKRCGSSRRTSRPRSRPCAPRPREGSGFGCTEAPRGILFHRYRLNADGTIADAKIVPPTSQNQKAIENDLRRFVERHLQLPNDTLTWKCEQAVRNYDPCISCATHFLKLQLDRDE